MPAQLLDRLTSVPASFMTADKRRLHLRAYAFLILLCFAFFTPGFATLPPTDRDESSFAQATKQMIETGNYVDIRLQDAPRYKKPIGIYWLQAASVRLLNAAHLDEIWAYRIPSFLGATTAVLMTAALGALLFGPMAGLIAAIMMAGCVILNVEARLAKTDAALLASIMVMQYALARAYLGKRGWSNIFTFWTALGAGILIKGPIIILVLLSTLLWLRITEKKLKWFVALKPLAGIPYLLLLVLPWFVIIMLQSHGAFATQSAGHDLLAKLWEGQNRGIIPPGVHLLILPIIFFPFGLFALLGIPDTWRNRQEPAVRFCLGWIIPTWIVFELSFTKLPHYTLPAYPAIAMLAAKALLDGFPVLAKKEGRWILASIVGLWMTIGTGYAALFMLAPYVIDQTWSNIQMAAGIVLVMAQAAALFLLFRHKTGSIVILTAGSLCFLAATFGSTLPSLQHLWVSRQIVQAAESVKPCDKLSIVAAGYDEPSLVFMAGTETKLAKNGPAAAAAMLADSCKVAVINTEDDEAFMDAFGRGHPAPITMGKIEGLNIGHGQPAEMTMYVRPVRLKTP